MPFRHKPETPTSGEIGPRTEFILRDQLALGRTRLANERTLLAYVRTALTFVVAGIAFLHFFESSAATIVGLAFLPTGAIVLIIGAYRFNAMRRQTNASISYANPEIEHRGD